MRILQVLPTLSAGGAEGFVTNLGVTLNKLGAQVCFFLVAGIRAERGRVLYERLLDAGIKVLGAEERNIRSPWNVLRLAKLIRYWRPDIVQANLHPAEVITCGARICSIGSGVRYVRRLANTKQSGNQPDWLTRRMKSAFDLTVACSPPVAKAYCDFLGESLSCGLVTIPNGGHFLDSIPTTADKVESRRSLGISGSAYVVAHIGRMWGVKNGTHVEFGQKAQ